MLALILAVLAIAIVALAWILAPTRRLEAVAVAVVLLAIIHLLAAI